MTNKYLEKIAAHLEKDEYGSEAWSNIGHKYMGRAIGLPIPLPGTSMVGAHIAGKSHLNGLARKLDKKELTDGQVFQGQALATLGGLGAGIAGGLAGRAIGSRINPAAAIIGAGIGGIGAGLAGDHYLTKRMIGKHFGKKETDNG